MLTVASYFCFWLTKIKPDTKPPAAESRPPQGSVYSWLLFWMQRSGYLSHCSLKDSLPLTLKHVLITTCYALQTAISATNDLRLSKMYYASGMLYIHARCLNLWWWANRNRAINRTEDIVRGFWLAEFFTAEFRKKEDKVETMAGSDLCHLLKAEPAAHLPLFSFFCFSSENVEKKCTLQTFSDTRQIFQRRKRGSAGAPCCDAVLL